MKAAPVREADIQLAIVGYITAVCPDAIFWAVPNSGWRLPGGRASNAVSGLLKGVPDLSVILPDGRFAAIEVKTPIGKLSLDQSLFLSVLSARHVPYCVASSVEDVRDFLRRLGVKTREVNAA